jgi:hypothetical protein
VKPKKRHHSREDRPEPMKKRKVHEGPVIDENDDLLHVFDDEQTIGFQP